MKQLTDNDLMPFGIHRDKKMANVPARYLIWLYENNKCNYEVKAYIEKNLDIIEEQAKRGY